MSFYESIREINQTERQLLFNTEIGKAYLSALIAEEINKKVGRVFGGY